jgi:hypothetical protein
MNAPARLIDRLPKGTPPELVDGIKDAIRNALDRDGLAAFAAPREAAIAHEAGHAIVGAHEGLTIQRVTIFSKPVPHFGPSWFGECIEATGWTTGPDTTAEADLGRARYIIGGLIAELLTGPDRSGSSLDEVALSQFVSLNAAAKLRDPMSEPMSEADYKQLWHKQVWDVTTAILQANREPFAQLAQHLNQYEKIEGARLRAVLAQVRSIPHER